MFDVNFILILLFSGAILFAYDRHYNTPLIYVKEERVYIATISFGFAAVGSALGIQIALSKLGFQENILNNAFIYSALVEESVKCVFILLVLSYNRVNEVLYDGLYYGLVFGGAFGLIENIIYASVLPFWPMMLRTITSSALHLLNGGIIGYFTAKYLFTAKRHRSSYLLQGFLLCYVSHALYNLAGFTGGKFLMILPILLVFNFILVEFISAYARSSLPKFALDLIHLSILDYELIRRHTKYESWLYNEQKVFKKKTNLFQKVSLNRILSVSTAFLISLFFITLYFLFPEIRSKVFKEILFYEYVSIFINYPLMVSISILFAGLVNPDFFQREILRVPLMCVLSAKSKDYEETTVVFYLTFHGFYAPFMYPEKLEGDLLLSFQIGNKNIENIKGKTIWIHGANNETQNIKSRLSVTGALIQFEKNPFFLITYWNWARWVLRIQNLLRLV
ncbi:MAG TPA: PrsW family glutamic-type intramembrane protease [Leptospiraceae bacterium]|nr:PrsW family glutamic-type intramembrane protease [Leptospiraceae bacterium]HMW04199.1 PrsW family glutamic-type intramembrane protease [Leptospiraceae bacterium]HMX32731.1 PrsW family glutamic-type intramembrane protease [Leptospiraceae bacterium]HMY30192.1 PrsW family glutamic-type intramembrane protease [Leptospiraceae bacterium]HMZ65175.1 PrsW family glutamic-type intramembrane protease [Leptospiraceae bacterium]